ncbi:MAG: hypothetical protein AB7I39_13500 [Arcobacter sp.]
MYNKISPIILICLLIFIFYAVFKKASQSTKTKRVECQTKTTTFEKIFVEEPIKEAIKAFKTGNYEINSSIEYSKYMKSHLKDILTKEQSDELLKNIINKYLISMEQKNQDKKVSINYYVYENDKEDSGKKNSEAKKYAGYLMFDFKYDKKLVYKIQIDYMDLDAKDLEDRMDCVINSFLSID